MSNNRQTTPPNDDHGSTKRELINKIRLYEYLINRYFKTIKLPQTSITIFFLNKTTNKVSQRWAKASLISFHTFLAPSRTTIRDDFVRPGHQSPLLSGHKLHNESWPRALSYLIGFKYACWTSKFGTKASTGTSAITATFTLHWKLKKNNIEITSIIMTIQV